MEGKKREKQGLLTFPSAHHLPHQNANGDNLYKKTVCAVFEHPIKCGLHYVVLTVVDQATKYARPSWIEVKAEYRALYDKYIADFNNIDVSWDVHEDESVATEV